MERKLLVYIQIAAKILKTNICCTTHPKRLIKIPTVVGLRTLIPYLRNLASLRTASTLREPLDGGVGLECSRRRHDKDPDNYEGDLMVVSRAVMEHLIVFVVTIVDSPEKITNPKVIHVYEP
jgi:hypothetical protein